MKNKLFVLFLTSNFYLNTTTLFAEKQPDTPLESYAKCSLLSSWLMLHVYENEMGASNMLNSIEKKFSETSCDKLFPQLRKQAMECGLADKALMYAQMRAIQEFSTTHPEEIATLQDLVKNDEISKDEFEKRILTHIAQMNDTAVQDALTHQSNVYEENNAKFLTTIKELAEQSGVSYEEAHHQVLEYLKNTKLPIQ